MRTVLRILSKTARILFFVGSIAFSPVGRAQFNDQENSEETVRQPPTPSETTSTETQQCENCDKPGLPPINLYAQPLPEIKPIINSPQLDQRCFSQDGNSLRQQSGFNAILARARGRGHGKPCIREMKSIACNESPWKDLDLNQRFNRLISLGKVHAEKYGLDVRAMPCIAAAETLTLEPLIKVYGACYNDLSTAQGLGQMTRSTLKSYVLSGGVGLRPFKSTIPPFNAPPYSSRTVGSAEKLFDAMATSVDLQMEIMAYTLREKKRKSSDYKMFYRYHGVSSAYATANNKCMICLRDRLTKDGQSVGKGDPVECLSHVARGNRGFYGRANKQIFRASKMDRETCNKMRSKGYKPMCGAR
ncbi:MAG: hypothetical protein IPJ71_08865 [Bdellovibrionales bacterium]|nr:hypothetical protein [Bdellovibrionales bacterium]